MGALGHYMLSASGRWHDVATELVREVLDAHVPSRPSTRSTPSTPYTER